MHSLLYQPLSLGAACPCIPRSQLPARLVPLSSTQGPFAGLHSEGKRVIADHFADPEAIAGMEVTVAGKNVCVAAEQGKEIYVQVRLLSSPLVTLSHSGPKPVTLPAFAAWRRVCVVHRGGCTKACH